MSSPQLEFFYTSFNDITVDAGLRDFVGLPKRQLIIRKKLPKAPTGLLGRSPPGLRRSLVYLY